MSVSRTLLEGATVHFGSYNYSSWSLRVLLMTRRAAPEVKERYYDTKDEDELRKIKELSPTGCYPVLELADGTIIWDTLSIVELVAEAHPEAHCWPADPKQRALARSIVAEMHSSFDQVRGLMPMDIVHKKELEAKPDALVEQINRIKTIWETCLKQSRGPCLFGVDFTIPDAFYAPVVWRFRTYGIKVSKELDHFAKTIMEDPIMIEWVEDAEREIANRNKK
eukprot:CAMPEP_0184518628 /NCGR_PEP_ID=MMETSP0198_2-20121128/6184_1 /TAXON_ID=1112570 /ORGANISM="Thraustochytrium sp., Strain LLF1b" /LENGTH=222 /DNA_ID=CAMNT_0026909069 /DNA_START=29 /DNA_END=697 /DNA_ORIENTATION=-